MAEEPPKQTSISTEQSSSASTFQKSSDDAVMKVPQIPSTYGSSSVDSNSHMYQTMFQPLLSGMYNVQQNQEELNRGPGLYAVSVHPFMDRVTGFPPNRLIPLTYSVPTSTEHRAGNDEQGQVGQQQQLQLQQQPPEPQHQVVVRRFQIAFQRDLFLILKLAAVIFLFNQDGSRQRLVVLVFFASLIYLYQTGALAPLIRWLSQGMQRGAAPPQRPRPAVRAENVALDGRQGNEDGAAEEGNGGGNDNQPGNAGNRAGENEQGGDPGVAEDGNRLWLIVKEIQMIVFGFITSLLPGFHNID